MIHPENFVNRSISLAIAFAFQILVGFGIGWTQEPSKNTLETGYYREAVERIGPPSKLVWSEPGDNSLNRWRPRSHIEVQGVVVSWEAEKLVVIKPDGNGPTNFPGDLVVGIEPSWKSASYAQVHELFKQRRFKDVLQQGQATLAQSEIPRWQQRVLVAQMVEAAVALQQYSVAGKVFKALAQENPPELLLSRIPLPWSDELLGATPTLTQEALGWLQSDVPSMQLLGASWLIGGEHRLAAIEKLKSLASGGSGLVSEYSKVQLWRVVPPEEILSERISEWIAQRDAMALPSQAGPTMLLAHRLEQTKEARLAIAQWLRVASLHSDRYHLVQQAKRRGIDSAKQTGDALFAQKIAASFTGLADPEINTPGEPRPGSN